VDYTRGPGGPLIRIVLGFVGLVNRNPSTKSSGLCPALVAEWSAEQLSLLVSRGLKRATAAVLVTVNRASHVAGALPIMTLSHNWLMMRAPDDACP
jgi:hypothetical protein